MQSIISSNSGEWFLGRKISEGYSREIMKAASSWSVVDPLSSEGQNSSDFLPKIDLKSLSDQEEDEDIFSRSRDFLSRDWGCATKWGAKWSVRGERGAKYFDPAP